MEPLFSLLFFFKYSFWGPKPNENTKKKAWTSAGLGLQWFPMLPLNRSGREAAKTVWLQENKVPMCVWLWI